MQRKSKQREFFHGLLIKAGEKSLTYTEFCYGEVQARQYLASSSVMPLEFVKPTETIRTSRVDLPFAKGDVVSLHDGSRMTIKDVSYDMSAERALMGIDARTAVVLTLEGGAK